MPDPKHIKEPIEQIKMVYTALEFKNMMAKKTSKKSNANSVTKAILTYLNSTGFFAWRNNTTGIWDETKKVFRKNHGLNGVSDILGIHKETGLFIAIEVKGGKDKVSEAQQYFLNQIEKFGGYALVAREIKDVIEYLEEKGVFEKESNNGN